jgi:phosphatidylglycerol:prolipoprotein diacylglycerol transferase
MFPFLFKFGDVVLPPFFTMIMIGILATSFYAYSLAPKRGLSQVAALDIGIVGAIMGIIGGRLFHVFFEAWWFYKDNYSRILEFWRGGFVSFGAYIGGTLGVILYLKLRKLPLFKYGDLVGLALPIMIMAIRIGCLSVGCCYGKPTDFFIHLTFPGPYVTGGPPVGVPVHATQIYDFLNGLFLFFFLRFVDKHKKFDGQVIMLFFILYSLIRFFIEFLRGDADRGLYFNNMISTGQITGLLIIAICMGVYFYLWKKSPRQARKG